MKHNEETLFGIGKETFKLIRESILTIGMNFSTRHNAIYGCDSATALIATMSKFGKCAEQSSERMQAKAAEFNAWHRGGWQMRVPSADWLLGRLGDIPYDTMHKRMNQSLRHTVRDAMRQGLASKDDIIAIDKTKMERYDKNPDLNQLIKFKGRGTNTAEAYITAKTVGGPRQFHVACFPLAKGDENPDSVRKLLDEIRILRLSPRLLLLDREFFAVDLLKTIDRAGRKFVMPARRTTRIKEALLEFVNKKRGAISEFVLTSKHGKEFPYTLVIIKKRKTRKTDKKEDKYMGFVTNCHDYSAKDLMTLPEEYGKRWGIETGYRDAKSIMPRTVSRNAAIRIALFYLSLIITNIWQFARLKRAGIKLKVMMEYATGLDILCMPPKKPPDPG